MGLDLAGFKERLAKVNTLGRADLVKEVHREFPQISSAVMKELVDTLFGVMSQALLSKKRVEIRGFGTFTAHRKNPRKSYIPSKGKVSAVDAKWVVKFLTGKTFRGKLMAHCEE